MQRNKPFSYGLALLAKLPPERLFQLFVDGALHKRESGQKGFEFREPGCMKAFYEGLALAIDRIDKPPFTQNAILSLVLDVHRAVTQHVKGEISVRHPGQIRNNPLAAFAVPKTRRTKQGISHIRKREFLKSTAKLKLAAQSDIDLLTCSDDYLSENIDAIYNRNDDTPLEYRPPPLSSEKLTLLLKQFFSDYSSRMSIASEQQNDNLKIQAIATLAKDCELLHPFGDANGRVFVNILLDVLLMVHGFPPATFYEPNIFDLYDDDELVDAIKDAMSHTVFVIEHPDKPLFGYDALKVDDDKRAQLTEESSALREALQKKLSETLPDEALLAQHINAVKQLLDTAWGGSLNAFRACAIGDIDTLKNMELNEEQLNMQAPQHTAPLYKGKTLLHLAVEMDHPEIVKFLLSHNKTIINQMDEEGNTPLIYACDTNNLFLVRFLLEQGADVALASSEGYTALDAAARYGSFELFQLILSVQNNPVAWQRLFVIAASGSNLALIQWMFDNQKISRAELSELCKSREIYNPLLLALRKQDVKMFRTLWICAFSISPVSCSDMACIFKEFETHTTGELLGYLFERMTISTDEKPLIFDLFETLLMSARKNDALIEKLIDLIPDLDTVIDSEEKKCSILHLTAATGRIAIAQKLLGRNFNINRREADGYSPLHFAIGANQFPMVEYLCSQPLIDINQRSNAIGPHGQFTEKRDAQSPLEFAVSRNAVEAVKILLAHQATVTDESFSWVTWGTGHSKIVELLLQAQAQQQKQQTNPSSTK
jgi:ankyrin repeat protein